MTIKFDELVTRVASCVVQVLALDQATVQGKSRLMEDLGADSLDLVELMYMLEQEFEITMNRDDMSLSAQLGLADEEIHDHEILTPRALDLLRKRYPWAEGILVDGIARKHLGVLITVEEVARGVERRLASEAEA